MQSHGNHKENSYRLYTKENEKRLENFSLQKRNQRTQKKTLM